jgi:hypothetical protein
MSRGHAQGPSTAPRRVPAQRRARTSMRPEGGSRRVPSARTPRGLAHDGSISR